MSKTASKLTTGRQTVIYYSTNHIPELFCFDSNTLKIGKNCHWFLQILPTFRYCSTTSLTVTHAFNLLAMYLMQKKKQKKKKRCYSLTSRKRQLTSEIKNKWKKYIKKSHEKVALCISDLLQNKTHITKTRLFKYTENFPTKKWKFLGKKFWYFSYFCSKT